MFVVEFGWILERLSLVNIRNILASEHFVRWWAAATLFLFLVTAWLSVGALHSDEYFQQLDFAAYKLGIIPASALPWEFHHAIRPWLQPALHTVLIYGAKVAGIENPFSWVRVLRFFYALAGWVACLSLSSGLRQWLPDRRYRSGALLLLTLVHTTAFLHARTSSENLSTILMTFAIAALLSALRYRWFLTGLLFGLMFQVRYQSAFVGLGAIAWVIFYRQGRLKHVAFMIFGGLAGLLVGTLADFWGYGRIVLAPLSYARINLLEGRAASFGISPWWDYFILSNKLYLFPFGTLAIVLMLVFFACFRRHLLTWMFLPFFVAHCLIGHKEPRFIYSMLYFVPICAVIGLASWYRSFTRPMSRGLLNFVGAIIAMILLQSQVRFNFSPLQRTVAALDHTATWLIDRNLTAAFLVYDGPKVPQESRLQLGPQNDAESDAVNDPENDANPVMYSGLLMRLYAPPGLKIDRLFPLSRFSATKFAINSPGLVSPTEIPLFYRELKVRQRIPITTPEGCELIYSSELLLKRGLLARPSNDLFGELLRRVSRGTRVTEMFHCQPEPLAVMSIETLGVRQN